MTAIVILGATGAVGGEVVQSLLSKSELDKLTLLGRREVAGINDKRVSQHLMNIFEVDSYKQYLSGHQTAICTLGVGQPTKVSKDDFIKIDKLAVLDFACESL